MARKQSSRIYLNGNYNKEIFFDGHYHDKAYICYDNGRLELVWEKLSDVEPATYTVEINKIINSAYCFSNYYVYANVTIYRNGTKMTTRYYMLMGQSVEHLYVLEMNGTVPSYLYNGGYAPKDIVSGVLISGYEDFGCCYKDKYLETRLDSSSYIPNRVHLRKSIVGGNGTKISYWCGSYCIVRVWSGDTVLWQSGEDFKQICCVNENIFEVNRTAETISLVQHTSTINLPFIKVFENINTDGGTEGKTPTYYYLDIETNSLTTSRDSLKENTKYGIIGYETGTTVTLKKNNHGFVNVSVSEGEYVEEHEIKGGEKKYDILYEIDFSSSVPKIVDSFIYAPPTKLNGYNGLDVFEMFPCGDCIVVAYHIYEDGEVTGHSFFVGRTASSLNRVYNSNFYVKHAQLCGNYILIQGYKNNSNDYEKFMLQLGSSGSFIKELTPSVDGYIERE